MILEDAGMMMKWE